MIRILFTVVQVIFAGLLGSFRGGEILPTGSTQLCRALWATLFSAMMLLHGLTIIPCVILAVAMFLSEWWVSHAPFQNVDKWYDYPGLFGVGAARGFIVAEALQHWYGTSIFWLPLLWGISQSLTYFIGYHIPLTWKTVVTSFAKGTPTSEFLADAFYFVSMLAIPLLPKLL